jgi:hypothetical protein
MVEEATMRATVDMSVRSSKKKVAGMVVHLANPLPIAMSSCLDNPHSFTNIQSPVMFISEDEQLIGHELIKALSTFKLSLVPPLSPSSRHESPPNNNAIVVHPRAIRAIFHKKFKFKSKNLGFKVIRDMLIKKCIIVKKGR